MTFLPWYIPLQSHRREENYISCTISTIFFLYIYIWSPFKIKVVICYLLLFLQMLFKLILSQFSFIDLTVISFFAEILLLPPEYNLEKINFC